MLTVVELIPQFQNVNVRCGSKKWITLTFCEIVNILSLEVKVWIIICLSNEKIQIIFKTKTLYFSYRDQIFINVEFLSVHWARLRHRSQYTYMIYLISNEMSYLKIAAIHRSASGRNEKCAHEFLPYHIFQPKTLAN